MSDLEQERLKQVKKFLELDFNKSSEFQDIVELAAQICEKPVALITLLDHESNWLKVKYGTDINVMPRATSFCQFAIEQENLIIVPDAAKDSRFVDNPLVHNDPNLRFYAGAPLIINNDIKLGTLCLFDQKPGSLTPAQHKILRILARQICFLMELEMNRIELRKQIEKTEAKNDSLMRIAQLQSHQIRQPLTSIMGLIDLVKLNKLQIDEQWLNMFESATSNFDKIVHEIIAESIDSKDLKSIGFNKIVEEIEDYAILLLDENGNVENWNKGAQKIKGYLENEIIGKNFSIFYLEEDIKNNQPKKLITEAREKGVARTEGWRLRKDGTKFWSSIVLSAIHNSYDKVIGYTKVTRDLTAIKDAQDAELISTNMYTQILIQTNKLSLIGGWELNLIKQDLTWTNVTKEIHGVDNDYLPKVIDAINFYKKGVSRVKITNAVNMAIENGTSWDLELKLITAQGKEIWIHSVGKSNFRDGVCISVYGTFQDISYRKKNRLAVKIHKSKIKHI